jgi:hypothetical protein
MAILPSENQMAGSLQSVLYIMLRDLLTQIACNKKPSLTWYSPQHVDSGKSKMKIAHGRYVYQLLKKRDFYFINVAKIGKN